METIANAAWSRLIPRKLLSMVLLVSFLSICLSPTLYADTNPMVPVMADTTSSLLNTENLGEVIAVTGIEQVHAKPAVWSVIPFLVLLLMIATGPLFYGRFWHKYYPFIAVGLGALVIGYYQFVLHDQEHTVHSMAEYFSFISLIAALYTISGGILIDVDSKGTPMANVMMLVFGALLANVIGTTGASMLLIRPFIRLNKDRIKPYQVVFFIFIVSNVGGCLTPIGDPPLFLGFLKGVPFAWTMVHLWGKWIFGVSLLSAIFYFIDRRNKPAEPSTEVHTGKITFTGSRNVLFLVVVIGAVFIDPNVIKRLPDFLFIEYHGDKLSYFRELIMLSAALLAYKTSNKTALQGNEFNFEPIREVGFLFLGIFATMMPALQIIGQYAHANADIVNVHSLYWASGGLSGILDNAPTYLNFLAASMGKMDMDIDKKAAVQQFAVGVMDGSVNSSLYLVAVSLASVFFGAFTYMGNAPNFMVKAIAQQNGVDMPSFAVYIIKYSIPFLLPVLFLTWLLFFVIL
ncbi:sodium:proton antiporter [soil metagenome]